MKRACYIAAALVIATIGTAEASNKGGMLFVHTTQEVYTAGNAPYAGTSGISCAENFGDCGDQEDCSSEVAPLNPTGSNEFEIPQVFYVLAAFPWNSCPRLSAVSFGLDYDASNVFIADSGMAGELEIPTGTWPDPFSGTAVTFNISKKAQLTEVYWFAAYAYYEAGTLAIIAHPTVGGLMADDTIPAVETAIAGYGVMGLGGASGSNPVLVTPVVEESWGTLKHIFSEGE